MGLPGDDYEYTMLQAAIVTTDESVRVLSSLKRCCSTPHKPFKLLYEYDPEHT